MDRVLHAERVLPGGGKRMYRAALSFLPGGVLVEHQGNPHLVWAGKLRPWSFAGYGPAASVPPTTEVTVLTPESIVYAIGAGFAPQIHGE